MQQQMPLIIPIFIPSLNQQTQSYLNIPPLFQPSSSSSSSSQTPQQAQQQQLAQIQQTTAQFTQTAPLRVMNTFAEGLFNEFLQVMLNYGKDDSERILQNFHNALATYLTNELGEQPTTRNAVEWFSRYIVIIQQFLHQYGGNTAPLPQYRAKAKTKAKQQQVPLKAISPVVQAPPPPPLLS